MRATWFLASILATLAVADSSAQSNAQPSETTISYFGGATLTDGVNLSKYTSYAAEVYAIDRTATTYDVRCEDGAPSSVCAIDSKTPWRIVQGPATYSFSAAENVKTQYEGIDAQVQATFIVQCSFTHTSESVSCSDYLSLSVSAEGTSMSSETVIPSYTIPADEVHYRSLKVTGGLKAFSADATATSPVTVSYSDAAQPIITAAPLAAAAAAAVGLFL